MNYTNGVLSAPTGIFTPESLSVSVSSSVTLSSGSNPINYDVVDHNVGQMSYSSPEITVLNAGIYSIKSSILFERTGLLGTLSNVRFDIEVDNGQGYQVISSDQSPDSTLSVGEISGLTPHRDFKLSANSKVRTVLNYDSTLSAVLSLVFPSLGQPSNFLSVSRIA